jgi:hypothetical protein
MLVITRLIIIMAFLTVGLIQVGPASAAPIRTESAPQVQLNETGSCTDEIGANYHVGDQYDGGSLRMVGVYANINVLNSSFRPCTYAVGNDGAFAWVGLQPGPNSGHSPMVFQVGLANCNDYIFRDNICDSDSISLFIQVGGGCTIQDPQIIDFGTVDDTTHTLSILRDSGGIYRVYYEGQIIYSISENDSKISCWIKGDTMAVWSGELWDGGDSLASTGNRLNFTNMLRQTLGYGWVHPPHTTGFACPKSDDSDQVNNYCEFTNSGSTGGMDMWTVAK